MAWVRVVGGVRELIVASDSRLSGGQHWDASPKILLLPRSDAVLSFAGDTADAYPLMLQAYNSILNYPPASKRIMDIADLKAHLVDVFDHSRKFISGFPFGQSTPDEPGATFALSGYSWRTKKFHVWTLLFDRSIGGFTFRPTTEWGGQDENSHKMIAYLGDEAAVRQAKQQLVYILRKKKKISTGSLDMEPFEVLRDIIRSGKYPSVGGPVQLVKIYEHSNVAPIGVYWPDRASGTIALLGRPLMVHETTRWGVIDPDQPDRARPFRNDIPFGNDEALSSTNDT
jgi:hypothetical protein